MIYLRPLSKCIKLGSKVSLDPPEEQASIIKNPEFNPVQAKNPQTFSAKKHKSQIFAVLSGFRALLFQ